MSDHNPLTCKDDDHDDCFYAQMSQANRREIGRRRFDGGAP